MRKVMIAIERQGQAVRLAGLVASLLGPRFEAHVVNVREVDSGRSFLEADATVEAAVDLLRAHGLDTQGHVATTDHGVARRLVEEARRLDVDIVVMGSRGRRSAAGLIGGSVSHALMAELDVPVLVLPDGARMPLHGLRRALVAVDSEAAAASLVAQVREFLGIGEVLAVHVPRPVAVHVGPSPGQTFAEIGETSTRVLAEAVAQFKLAGYPVTGRTVERDGGTDMAVAAVARTWDADVIVLGPRRPSDLAAVVAGSTMHGVLRHSDRPVLIAGSRPAMQETDEQTGGGAR
jgi:nucleotide-binding universal stress UspA family protein